MGYSTQYSLQIKPLEGPQMRQPKTMTELISELEKSDGVDRQALLADLKTMQAGQSIALEPEDILTEFQKQSEGARYALTHCGATQESCKWYEHDEDLARFSKKYPQWLFTLRGEGEEAGDLWVKYFVAGKMQIAKAVISYEPFDPAKLA